jgi:hypothetical protein
LGDQQFAGGHRGSLAPVSLPVLTERAVHLAQLAVGHAPHDDATRHETPGIADVSESLCASSCRVSIWVYIDHVRGLDAERVEYAGHVAHRVG